MAMSFSANFIKQVQRVRQFHEKVANQRKDFLHKLSYNLAKDYSIIAVEHLNSIVLYSSLRAQLIRLHLLQRITVNDNRE